MWSTSSTRAWEKNKTWGPRMYTRILHTVRCCCTSRPGNREDRIIPRKSQDERNNSSRRRKIEIEFRKKTKIQQKTGSKKKVKLKQGSKKGRKGNHKRMRRFSQIAGSRITQRKGVTQVIRTKNKHAPRKLAQWNSKTCKSEFPKTLRPKGLNWGNHKKAWVAILSSSWQIRVVKNDPYSARYQQHHQGSEKKEPWPKSGVASICVKIR